MSGASWVRAAWGLVAGEAPVAGRQGPVLLRWQQHAEAGDAAFEFLELTDVCHDREKPRSSRSSAVRGADAAISTRSAPRGTTWQPLSSFTGRTAGNSPAGTSCGSSRNVPSGASQMSRAETNVLSGRVRYPVFRIRKGSTGLERQHRRGPGLRTGWDPCCSRARSRPGTAAEPGRTAGGHLWSGLRPRGEDRRCLRPPGPAPARFDSINAVRIRDTSSPAERRPSLGR